MLATAEVTYACSCSRNKPEYFYKDADAIFTGKIVEINGSKLTFEVEKSWKLITTNKITVTDIGELSCKPIYSIGENLLLYANGNKDALQIHMCAVFQANEEEHLAYLKDKPTLPMEKPEVQTEKSKSQTENIAGNYQSQIIAACIIVLLFVGIGFLIKTFRK